jgi:tripartite-type tricarboxylate transporter receptor subunit TctC
VVALAVATTNAFAADPFPSKAIRIIVPFAAGGLIDTTTRLVAQKMSETLRQPVIVENLTGAGGLIGIRAVKSAPPDGYTLLSTSNSFALALATQRDAGYDFKDFVGIGGMNEAPLILVGSSAQPDTTLGQLLARAKANPETITFASGGVGTSSWMAGAMLMNQAGVRLIHVPYKGVVAAAPDVLSGRVNMMFETAASAGSNIRDGRVRAFGVSSATRINTFPDIPTLAEQGIKNFTFSAYQGLLAPAGTPPEIVRTLSQALRYATSSEEFHQRNRREGNEPMTLSGEAFLNRLRQDSETAAKLLADAGISKQ